MPVCGDGVENLVAEVCDKGGNQPTCDADCSAPHCGDGYTNPTFHDTGMPDGKNEECDTGGIDSAGCDPDCTFAVWDPPRAIRCPECGADFLVEKQTKKGTSLRCLQCKSSFDPEAVGA